MNLFNKKHTSQPVRRRTNGVARPHADAQEMSQRYAFRRNQTLTGSLVSGVTSPNERRAQLKSSRVQSHDLRHHRRHLFLLLVGVLTTSAALFFLIDQSVAVPKVAKTFEGDQAMYEEKIDQYLISHPAQRFRFSLKISQLTNYLQENGFPEVAAVSPDMNRSGFGQTTFTLVMRQAAVVWMVGNQRLFVDTEGHAFKRSYGNQSLVEVIDQSGIGTRNNQVLASDSFLGFIGKVVGAAQNNRLTVQQIRLPAGTTRQVYVLFEGVSYPLKLSVDRSAGEQVEDASRAIRYFQKKGITPEYVDVRVTNKAYYK